MATSSVTSHFTKSLVLIFLVSLIVGVMVNLVAIFRKPELAVQLVDYYGLPPVYAADITCPSENCNQFSIGYVNINPNLCAGKDVFLVILITSPPENKNQRDAIRKTWGVISNNEYPIIVVGFFVGLSANGLSPSYENEMRKHGDLVITKISETYRNLTAKTANLLTWAGQYCSSAKYIMKTDDDSLNFLDHIIEYLRYQDHTKDLLIGECASGIRPYRDRHSKWYVSKEEYRGSFFPLYLRGRGYIMTRSTLKKLLATAPQVVPNSMEDVFWTGFCRWKANIQVDCSKNFAVTNENELIPRCTIIQQDLFNVHHVKYHQFELYWSWFKDKAKGKLDSTSEFCHLNKPRNPIIDILFILVVLIFTAIVSVIVRTKLRNKIC